MSTGEHAEVVGVFRDQTSANQAVEALKQAGIGDAQIRLTGYDPHEGGDSPYAAEMKRIIVHVEAEGRETEIVDILVNNGANNGDLPPGTRLEHGAIVRADQETVDLIPKEATSETETGGIFEEATEPGHPDEIDLGDSSNYPHG